jgi:hypothetical protein
MARTRTSGEDLEDQRMATEPREQLVDLGLGAGKTLKIKGKTLKIRMATRR